jgi:hypothetical protein
LWFIFGNEQDGGTIYHEAAKGKEEEEPLPLYFLDKSGSN